MELAVQPGASRKEGYAGNSGEEGDDGEMSLAALRELPTLPAPVARKVAAEESRKGGSSSSSSSRKGAEAKTKAKDGETRRALGTEAV